MAQDKKWYYQQLAIAKAQLGLGDDDYRQVLHNFGAKPPKYSATSFSMAQLRAVRNHFIAHGFKPQYKPQYKPRPRIAKVQQQLKAAGLTDAYANGIASRMYQNKNWRKLSDDQLSGLIAALRKRPHAQVTTYNQHIH